MAIYEIHIEHNSNYTKAQEYLNNIRGCSSEAMIMHLNVMQRQKLIKGFKYREMSNFGIKVDRSEWKVDECAPIQNLQKFEGKVKPQNNDWRSRGFKGYHRHD